MPWRVRSAINPATPKLDVWNRPHNLLRRDLVISGPGKISSVSRRSPDRLYVKWRSRLPPWSFSSRWLSLAVSGRWTQEILEIYTLGRAHKIREGDWGSIGHSRWMGPRCHWGWWKHLSVVLGSIPICWVEFLAYFTSFLCGLPRDPNLTFDFTGDCVMYVGVSQL